MALGSNSIDGAATPNRKTHVVFDESQSVLVQSAFSLERTAKLICRGKTSSKTNVVYKPTVGLRVASYADDIWSSIERTDAQSGWLSKDLGTLSCAPGIEVGYRFRAITGSEVTGIDTGASGSLTTQGAPYHRRMWKDTDDVSTLNLSTVGFNQPDTSDSTYVMDRIIESKDQYQWQSEFVFCIDVVGVRQNNPDAIATFYFPGPASQIKGSIGRGEYALKLYGTGKAKLFERITTGSPYTWVERSRFQWATPGMVCGHHHLIKINSTKSIVEGGGAGGAITFNIGQWAQEPKTMMEFIGYAKSAIMANSATDHNQLCVYKVPRYNSDAVASNPCAIRVDVRRDLRGVEVGVYVPQFRASGTFQDDPFKVNVCAVGGPGFTLQWYADIPSVGIGGTGATVDLKLYDASTGSEVAGATVVNANTKTYNNPARYDSTTKTLLGDELYVVATLTSSDNRALSPTVKSYKVYRDAYTASTGTTAYEFVTDSSGGNTAITKAVTGIQITGAERDISHEMAIIKGADLTGSYSTLKLRSGIPVNIYTEYDPLDATKKLYLFDGYVTPTDTAPIPGGKTLSSGPNKVLPAANAYTLDLHCVGKWKRLKELTFAVISQLWLAGDGQTWKVTDLVSAILLWAGFSSSQINIPDDPLKLYGQGGDSFFGFEPMANALDVIQRLLFEYLGWFLVWDRNVGTSGQWIALKQVRGPNYTNVAAFVTGAPPQVDGSKRIAHNVNSYPLANTLSDGKTYTSTAPTIFINKGTLKKKVIPPEGNLLYVSTVSAGGSNGVSEHLTICRPNYKSYNFDPAHPTADPNHRDYLGRCVPIYYIVPSLGALGIDAPAALARLWRRIFDVACHAVDVWDAQVPIVPITNEYETGKKRILRHYDPVTIDGEQFIVRNFNPMYEKDSVQMAMIQFERPNF